MASTPEGTQSPRLAATWLGRRDFAEVLALQLALRERVIAAEPRARLEYVQVGDAATLEQLAQVDRRAVIATAVWFGDVRLIDNLPLMPTG